MRKFGILLLVLLSCERPKPKLTQSEEPIKIVQACVDSLSRRAAANKEEFRSVTLEKNKYLPEHASLKWGDKTVNINSIPDSLKKITFHQERPERSSYFFCVYDLTYGEYNAHVTIGELTRGSEDKFTLSLKNHRWHVDTASVVDTVE